MKISNDIIIRIVEDDPVQAQLLQDKMLAFNSEYTLQWLKSGEELIQHYKMNPQKSRINYVILDYFLQTTENKEAINGFEVINQMKIHAPKAKIILYSAFDSDGDKKFESLKEEPNVIDVVKKSEYSFSSLQNILRFDYSKEMLSVKKSRFRWAILAYVVACAAAFLYLFSTNFFV